MPELPHRFVNCDCHTDEFDSRRHCRCGKYEDAPIHILGPLAITGATLTLTEEDLLILKRIIQFYLRDNGGDREAIALTTKLSDQIINPEQSAHEQPKVTRRIHLADNRKG